MNEHIEEDLFAMLDSETDERLSFEFPSLPLSFHIFLFNLIHFMLDILSSCTPYEPWTLIRSSLTFGFSGRRWRIRVSLYVLMVEVVVHTM